MSFNWSEYIDLADKLIEDNPREAEMRSATSRAYYGAFIQCRTYKSQTKHTHDIHKTIIEKFKTSDSPNETALGNHLGTLRFHRNNADYDGFYTPKLPETRNHINMARRIINLLEQVKNDDEHSI